MILIFVFKGFTAYSLLKEKNWAITLGVSDAIVRIILSFATLYPLINPDAGTSFTLRLDFYYLFPI